MATATTNGFNQWVITVPGQHMRVLIEAETEAEALAKFAQGAQPVPVTVPVPPPVPPVEPTPPTA